MYEKKYSKSYLFKMVLFACSIALGGCGGGGAGGGGAGGGSPPSDIDPIPPITATVGGNLSGLTSGQSVELSKSDGKNLKLTSNGAFTFSNPIPKFGGYSVAVSAQPSNGLCTVENGSGSNVEANVTTISVTCSEYQFKVGGAVTGLLPGRSVVVRNNDTDETALGTNGSFSFATPIAMGSGYNVTIIKQPFDQSCQVENGAGSNILADVTNINVNCAGNGPPDGNIPEYVPLSWANDLSATKYQLSNGTLVTRLGARVRDRHAREGYLDNYNAFPAHYFEKRTQEVIVYDNIDPNSTDKTNPDHVLTVVVRPDYWMYDVNFRHGYGGDVARPNLYIDNSNMKVLDPNNTKLLMAPGADLDTPLKNYQHLGSDVLDKTGKKIGTTNIPNGDYDPCNGSYSDFDGECRHFPDNTFVMVKEIRTMANDGNRKLKTGDMVEFELGQFLAHEQNHRNVDNIQNRFNYYSDAMTYQVGKLGVQPWVRLGGSNSSRILYPALMPDQMLFGGDMTLHQNAAFNEGEKSILMQAGPNIANYHMQTWAEGRRLFHVSYLTGTHTEPNNPIYRDLFGDNGWTKIGNSYDDIQVTKPLVGPAYSQTRCIDCHAANGRSSPRFNENGINTTLSNMAVLTGDSDAQGKQIPHPLFGTHLLQGVGREKSNESVRSPRYVDYNAMEAILSVSYQTVNGSYTDGSGYTLHQPKYLMNMAGMGTQLLPSRLSVRAAPQIIGMGLLEAVDEQQTLEPLVLRQKGTSTPGKLQIVTDAYGVSRVGRFGWKGAMPTVEAQISGAFNNDMGVTTPMFPKYECALGKSPLGLECARQNNNNKPPALSADQVEQVAAYVRLLGVPTPRFLPETVKWVLSPSEGMQQLSPDELDAEKKRVDNVNAGKVLFGSQRLNCVACHVDTMVTGGKHRFVELRNQVIHPYSDLLLHDMGPGLADDYLEGRAKGSEWRTAPLWGIGTLAVIDPRVRYLHDGRAASLEEAILWHGGQAQASRDAFKNLSKDERNQLLEFIKAL